MLENLARSTYAFVREEEEHSARRIIDDNILRVHFTVVINKFPSAIKLGLDKFLTNIALNSFREFRLRKNIFSLRDKA